MTCTLAYNDGTSHSQTFDVYNVRGIDAPWKWRLIPDIIFEKVDGSAETQYRKFIRIFHIELSAVSDYENFLRAFFQCATKTITYQGSLASPVTLSVVFEGDGFENQWYEDCQLSKLYVFDLVESTAISTWPT
jgi:hypothetical protein